MEVTNLKQFNLKVGDEVVFPDEIRHFDDRKPAPLNVGKVVGVYPYVFHIEYMCGPNKDIKMYRSFRRLDYPLGEVVKRDRE